jgi:NADH:ubiquinone oxidoreductase subunit E
MSALHPAETRTWVHDWSPNVVRDGNTFDRIYAQLQGEIDEIVAQYEDSRSALIPMAHLYQDHEGFVSPNAMAAIAYRLGLTLATVESTVSFYTLLFRRPIGKYLLQVCRNLSCLINGAEPIMDYFRAKLGVGSLETTDDGLFSYEEVECLAACDQAPCMQVNLEFVFKLTPTMIDDMLVAMREHRYPVKPLVQTQTPPRTWHVDQDIRTAKSKGAQGVSNPNAPGGIGDPSGVIMLDRLVTGERFQGRSNERLVNEKNLRPPQGNGSSH